MRIMVVGAGGQLGEKVARLSSERGHVVIGTYMTRAPAKVDSSFQMDKTKREQVSKFVEEVKPDIIVDTGALHNVDY
ncbi:MAG: sugar nucleotide-binding protein [Nitrososphaerales archaeon]